MVGAADGAGGGGEKEGGGRGGEEGGGGTTGGAKRTPPSPGGGKRANQLIATPPPSYSSSSSMLLASLGVENESQRKKMLEAVRSIATGRPRPGHSAVGAGTYRDGMGGWVALAREYARLATTATTTAAAYDDHDDVVGVDSADSDAAGGQRPRLLARGPVEVALYASRGGEVTTIEHLAHVTPEYLREAGGAMARIFFV